MDQFGTNVGARVRHFDNQNGGKMASVVIGSMLLFPTGARRDVDPYGVLLDPPTDERERLSLIVRFWDAKASEGMKEFERLREHLLSHARAALEREATPDCVGDDDDVERLKELRTAVRQCQAEATKAKKALESLIATGSGESIRREQAKRHARNRARNAELLARIEKIKL